MPTVPSVSAQFSVTVRVELDARQEPLGQLTSQIAEAGGALQGVDLVPGAGGEGKRVREFTIDARDQEHWEEILRAIGSTRGARVIDYVDREVPVLARMFEKRLRGYRAIGYVQHEGSFFDDIILDWDEDGLRSIYNMVEEEVD